MLKFGIALTALAGVMIFGNRVEGRTTSVPLSISACYPSDDYTQDLLGFLRRLAVSTTPPDSLFRAQAKLPLISDTTSVYLVSDSTTCAAALVTHNQYLSPTDLARPEAQRLYLFRYAQLWIASNPYLDDGSDFTPHVVMDSTFQRIKGFLF